MRRLLVVLALLALAAACGGDDTGAVADTSAGTDATVAAPTTSAAAATTASPAGSAAPAGATLDVVTSGLGEILVDGDGFTVYIFGLDGPGTSACDAGCIQSWPPVPGGLVAGDGVDGSLIGSITRDDGSSQATYADRPLYRYAADTAPGDTRGQAVGDVWFVVGTDGEPITDAAAMSLYGDY